MVRVPITMWIVAAGVLAGAAGGCGDDTVRPPSRQRAETGWISPQAADTVRGFIEMAAWADLEEPVREVRFYAGGGLVGVRRTPPWSLAWRPPESEEDLRIIELRFEAHGVEAKAEGAPLAIWYLRDDAPRIELEIPGRTRWVEIAGERSLTARAVDREDGVLGPEAIQWSTADGRRFRGTTVPLHALGPGSHRIVVSAIDRAGNRAETSLELHPFRYEGGATAIEAARDLQRALSALDLVRVDELLAPAFQLSPCVDHGAERADPVSRVEFLAALERFAQDPLLDPFQWGGRLEPLADPVGRWALVGWNQLGVLVGRNGEPEWRTVGLRARLTWERGADGRYRAEAWDEVDPGDGPGIAGFLRAGPPHP